MMSRRTRRRCAWLVLATQLVPLLVVASCAPIFA